MTLSAEDRARALMAELFSDHSHSFRHQEDAIAQAIRQAQNDKLEEAARVAAAPVSVSSTSFQVNGDTLKDSLGDTSFISRTKVNELLTRKATEIRSLITKD